ncbi:MAG: hypothetical protein MJ176_03515 [Treponema sp.]|nr:hypothetical protein [Treponema sp.]
MNKAESRKQKAESRKIMLVLKAVSSVWGLLKKEQGNTSQIVFILLKD